MRRATVILRAKLASGLRSKFYARRYNVPPSEVIAVQLPFPPNSVTGPSRCLTAPRMVGGRPGEGRAKQLLDGSR